MAHIHAKLMMQYAEDAAKYDRPWELWEIQPMVRHDKWTGLKDNPRWAAHMRYQSKPVFININGFEVPEPIRKPLELGQHYYIVTIDNISLCSDLQWENDEYDMVYLNLGICHLTKEAAVLHAKALLSFTQTNQDT